MRLRASNSSFLMASGAVYFAFRKSLVAEIFDKHGSVVQGPSAYGSVKLHLENDELQGLSAQKMHALLVHAHELEHSRSFFGSPLGLLIFRCYFTICATLGWLFETFFIPGKLGAEGLTRATFLEWLEKDSVAWISAKIAAGELTLPPYSGAKELSPEELRAGVLSYVEQIAVPEVSFVAKFVRALVHRDPDMSMGGFADLANMAFFHLARACEIKTLPLWTTESPDQPLYPKQDSILSTEEILEYVALQVERMTMERMGLPAAAIRRWRSSFDHAPYLAGFSLEEKGTRPLGALIPFAHAALRTPIDLVVGSKVLSVESVHPTWRMRFNYFTQFDAQTCPRTGLSYEERSARLNRVADFPSWERRLCEMSVVPQVAVSSLKGIDIARTDIFGPGMVSERQARPLSDPRISPSKDYEVVREAFRAGLRPTLAGKVDPHGHVVLPLHYYDDICSFNTLNSGQDMFKVVGAHRLTVVNYLMLSLLYGGAEKPNLPPFGPSFFARLDGIAPGQTGNIRATLMERPIATAIFGAPFADSLRWW